MSQASSLGRGTLYIFIARILFVLSGYATYLVLGRVLGPELFGVYGVVTALVFVISIVLLTSVQQTTSKFISENPGKAEAIKYQMFKMQVVVALVFFVLYYLLAPLFAAMFKDVGLVPYIRFTALIIVFQSLFFVFVGYLNGLKRFKAEAIISSLNSVLKAVLVIALVFLGYSIFGALSAFVLTAVISLVISILFFKLRPQKSPLPTKRIVHFGFPLFLFAIITLLLTNLDLFFVKTFSPQGLANILSGYYTASLTLARIPYYIITALTITLFPVISESTYLGKTKRTVKYIATSLKYTVVLLAFVVFMIASSSGSVAQFFYGAEYAPAATSLSILIFGGGFLALFLVLTTIISASGKPKHAFIVGFVALAIDFIMNYLLVPRYQLVGAAVATSTAMLFAVIISGYYVRRRFRVFLSTRHFVMIVLASLILSAISLAVPVTGVLLVAKYALFSAAYIGLLVLFKVLDIKDWLLIKKIFLKV